jgi:hypothetical protein
MNTGILGRRLAFAGLILAVLTASAGAQTVTAPYSENFDGTPPTLPAGWTVVTAGGAVMWAMDATPAALGGGTTGPGGTANVNDGVDYEDGVTIDSQMDSPPIDVSGLSGGVLIRFDCAYELEEEGSFDFRKLQVLDDSTSGILVEFDFDGFGSGVLTPCGAENVYHTHALDVTAATAGVPIIRLRYRLETLDGAFNAAAGWFIDALEVTCPLPDLTAPTPTPTLLLPADASIVPSPPGVTLDWTDSTDTSPCGPSSPIYDVYFDTVSPPLVLLTSVTTSTFTTGVLGVGTYFWRIETRDAAGNFAAPSAIFSFTVEPPFAPSLPDTLFVNEGGDGAQMGDPGFVDPVLDEFPVFSAIYRDPNTVDSAVSLRYQVSDDPAFLTLLVDILVLLAPNLPKDTRCADLPCNVQLNRDTVYYWRIQFTDIGGLTGGFASQSFRIGDDFEFGVRPGSTNHSRRCFVATAAWGGVTPEVESLMSARAGIESSGAGLVASQTYRGVGPALASGLAGSGSFARTSLSPLAAASRYPVLPAGLCVVLLVILAASGLRRI